MTAEAIVKPFAVIDMKAGRFFLVEGARRPHITLALIGLARIPHDFAPHNLREAGTCTQFIKETGREAHPPNMGRRAAESISRARLERSYCAMHISFHAADRSAFFTSAIFML